ncbi:MAG: hypothetical protein Q8S33_37865 [Myxococcales bacterium]|nr:hypothetical protein [Myxococcales bacterium]
MLLALLLAAAPAPVELHVLSAGLLAPETKRPLGAMEDVFVTPVKWVSPTLFKARHESSTVELEALLDLSREGTFVEAVPSRDVMLSGTGAWVVVLKRGAKVPLLGRLADGLRIGFLPQHLMVTSSATVPDEVRSVPPATGEDKAPGGDVVGRATQQTCVVRAMYARPEAGAAKWQTSSFAWTIHRGASSKTGWAAAWADGQVAIVHGFVRDSDVDCEVGSGGGLGLSGVGGGSGDGFVIAEEATLPAGTTLFTSARDASPFATLRAPIRALRLEDGTWRTDLIKSGPGWVRFSNVALAKGTVVMTKKAQTHGVGSSVMHQPEWPHLRP